jgi:hypothetical protein
VPHRRPPRLFRTLERAHREEHTLLAGYFDRVLRREEATLAVVRYVLLNPVRAGLCVEPSEYPLLGSSQYAVSELAAASEWGALG